MTSARLFCEPLEERIALANMIEVTTLLDLGNPSGTISLRQAITQANSDAGGGDTITFDESLFSAGPGTITLGSALPTITADPHSPVSSTLKGGTSNLVQRLTVATSVRVHKRP